MAEPVIEEDDDLIDIDDVIETEQEVIEELGFLVRPEKENNIINT